RDGPVFLSADFDLGVRRGPHAGDGQFGRAIEKELDRLAAALLGELGALDAPAVGGELAAEAPADMVHVDLDLSGGQLPALGDIAAHAGDVLGRRPVLYGVAAPLHDLAMRLETAMRDDRNSVFTLEHDVGVLEALIGVAGDLLAGGFGAGTGFGQIIILDQV